MTIISIDFFLFKKDVLIAIHVFLHITAKYNNFEFEHYVFSFNLGFGTQKVLKERKFGKK